MSKPSMFETVTKVQQKLSEEEQNPDVSWGLFKVIMENTDFNKCPTAIDSLMLFYKKLYIHALAPLEDEKHLLHKEVGRLIIESDDNRRKAEKLEEENTSLREQVQAQNQAGFSKDL